MQEKQTEGAGNQESGRYPRRGPELARVCRGYYVDGLSRGTGRRLLHRHKLFPAAALSGLLRNGLAALAATAAHELPDRFESPGIATDLQIRRSVPDFDYFCFDQFVATAARAFSV